MLNSQKTSELPALSISPEKVFYIIAEARQLEARDGATDLDADPDASESGLHSASRDEDGSSVRAEIIGFIHDMNEDEQIDLVALAWLGRGDGDLGDWSDIRAEAARAHNKRTASYLLSKPLLADHLEEALALFGHSHEESDDDRL